MKSLTQLNLLNKTHGKTFSIKKYVKEDLMNKYK